MQKQDAQSMSESKPVPTLDYQRPKPLPSQDPELRELLFIVLAVAGVFVLAMLFAIISFLLQH